jgi:hypothetical protein
MAAKMGIPVLALIREPREAILSQLVREPGISLQGALGAYTRFYSSLMPYRSRMVAGEFDEVTQSFGSVVRKLNNRFGTSFTEFEHNEANLEACRDLVKERATPIPEWSTVVGRFEAGLITRSELDSARERLAHQQPSEPPGSKDVWLPSSERSQSKDRLREQWSHPDLMALRTQAQLAYERFIAGKDA